MGFGGAALWTQGSVSMKGCWCPSNPGGNRKRLSLNERKNVNPEFCWRRMESCGHYVQKVQREGRFITRRN